LSALSSTLKQPENTPHWHILGLGSLGSLSAYYLLQSGFTVSALPRTPTHLVARTLHFPLPQSAPITLSLRADDHGQPITHLWLTVKAHDTARALRPWLPRLANNVTIVCLQNGMGTLDGIDLPEACNLIYASSTNGVWRGADQIHIAAENNTQMGNGSHAAPAWFAPLQQQFRGLHWNHHIDDARWQKLTVNAVINPLTALYQCRNGELLDGGEREQAMEKLADEIDRLCTRIFSRQGWPSDTLKRSRDIAEQTAQNTSSMLADCRAGRRTEIDFINGFLLRQAEKYGIALPFNQTCVERIHKMH
jgi:2-dehydropantoate 2-reductase